MTTFNRIYRFWPARKVDEPLEDYIYNPVTDSVTQRLDDMQLSAGDSDSWFFIWGNRALTDVSFPATVGNVTTYPQSFIEGTQVKAFFTSYVKADAATRIILAYVLDYPDTFINNIANNHGLTLAYRPDHEQYIIDGSYTDVVVMPTHRLPEHARGVMIDYERADGADACRTVNILTTLKSLAEKKGKELFVLINGLDAPSTQFTGIIDDFSSIASLTDGITLHLWSGNPIGTVAESFEHQIDIALQGCVKYLDTSKVIVFFEMNGTTVQDAVDVRSLSEEYGIDQLFIWRNFLGPGQGDFDAKLSALLD